MISFSRIPFTRSLPPSLPIPTPDRPRPHPHHATGLPREHPVASNVLPIPPASSQRSRAGIARTSWRNRLPPPGDTKGGRSPPEYGKIGGSRRAGWGLRDQEEHAWPQASIEDAAVGQVLWGTDQEDWRPVVAQRVVSSPQGPKGSSPHVSDREPGECLLRQGYPARHASALPSHVMRRRGLRWEPKSS